MNALQVTMMVNKHYYNRKEKQKIAETIIITTEEFIEIKPKVLKKKCYYYVNYKLSNEIWFLFPSVNQIPY